MPAQIESTIRQFIEDNYLFRTGDALSAEDSLIESGLIDSVGVLELVAFLEETFGIRMSDEELVPANLDAIRSIVNLVERKLGVDRAPSAAGSAACV